MRVEGARTAVILDQHPLWVDAVDQVLQPLALDVVAKTTSIADALDAVATLSPALFLMDLDLDDPPLAGLECIRKARELAPGLAVGRWEHPARRGRECRPKEDRGVEDLPHRGDDVVGQRRLDDEGDRPRRERRLDGLRLPVP